jgi:hypothetical protein
MFALPLEANAILIIDPNAVLASPITSQALETIARGQGQLSQLTHSIDLIELAPSHSPQVAWAQPPCCWLVRAIENRLSASVPEGSYHVSHYIE